MSLNQQRKIHRITDKTEQKYFTQSKGKQTKYRLIMKTKVKIKIIKSRSDVLWYRGKVGETLTVTDEGKTKDYYVAISKRNMEKIIYKEDCKEL